jgi:hypothetical protein
MGLRFAIAPGQREAAPYTPRPVPAPAVLLQNQFHSVDLGCQEFPDYGGGQYLI